MGYGATNGAAYIQGYLSDRVMTPADFAPYYTEKLFILPVPFYVTSYKVDAERQHRLMQQALSFNGSDASKDFKAVAPVRYPTIAGVFAAACRRMVVSAFDLCFDLLRHAIRLQSLMLSAMTSARCTIFRATPRYWRVSIRCATSCLQVVPRA
jgi:hypothetical protein